MQTTMPARFVGVQLPTTSEDSELEVRDRLARSLRQRRMSHYGKTDETGGFSGTLEEFENWLEEGALSPSDRRRIFQRARRFHHARVRLLDTVSHIKGDDRKALIWGLRDGQAYAVLGRDAMEERIAALHSEYPWLAPASNAVMQHMRARTATGAAPFHTQPMILLGPPGIAKSSWTRAVARIFDLPSLTVDIGATNGATFTISGVERGWGSAAPGRVVQMMLRERVANPLVILDEIDKIPDQIATSKGNVLPGAFEVLKSMIEPTTAQNWTCPYYQVPFDLTRVSWVMTTNSIDHLPDAFLDRCKLVRLAGPTMDQLMHVGREMIAARLPDALWETGREAIENGLRNCSAQHSRISLRMVERMADSITEMLSRPRLI